MAHNNNSLGIKTDGTLWLFGQPSYGNIGNNSELNPFSPVQIGTNTSWVNGSSTQHTLAIKQ